MTSPSEPRDSATAVVVEPPDDPSEEVTELARTAQTVREARESLEATASTLAFGTSPRALRQAMTVVEGQLDGPAAMAADDGVPPEGVAPERTRMVALSALAVVGYAGIMAALWLSVLGRARGGEPIGALIPLIVVSQVTFLLLVGVGIWVFGYRRRGARALVDERWESVAQRSEQDVAGTLGDRPDQDEVVAALVAMRLVEPDERRLSSRLRRDGSRFLYRAVWEVLQLDRRRLLPFSTVVALARVLTAQGTQMTRIVSAVSVVVLGVRSPHQTNLDESG